MATTAYMTLKQVQKGCYQAYWFGTGRPVCHADGTPLDSFRSRKEYTDYIASRPNVNDL